MNAMADRIEAPQIPARLANVETEMAMVGMLLIDNRFVDLVADHLAQEHFSEPLLGRIYARTVQIVSSGDQAAAVSIAHEFETDPAIVAMGTTARHFLGQITASSGVLLLQPRATAKLISGLAKQRVLYAEAGRIREQLEEGVDGDLSTLIEQADTALSKLTEKPAVSRRARIAKAFDRTLERIRAEKNGDVARGVRVEGLDDVNHLFGKAMRAGKLIYLAGRPGMGKTALAISTALASGRAGNGTVFYSLEMEVEDLTERAIADLIYEHGNSLSLDNLQQGNFTAFDEQAITNARAQIESWPLELVSEPELTLNGLARSLRRIKREMAAKGDELRVVFIDYLQLMSGDQRRQSRTEFVGELSRGLKVLAGQLGIVIIALSQLSRKCEEREDKRPMLSDLRESGSIEQDADAVGFVFREQYYLEMAEPKEGDKNRAAWETDLLAARDRMELIAAKVRQGKTGRRRLHYFLDNQAVRGSRFYQDTHQ